MSYNFKYEDLKLDNIHAVTKSEIDQGWESFNRHLTIDADNAIKEVMKVYPDNSSLVGISLKCNVINGQYHAGVFNNHISTIAEIINGLNFDERIEKGDISLVQELVQKSKEKTGRYYYCFITKYCSWHNSDKFPIFDNIVLRVLKLINKNYYKLFERGLQIVPSRDCHNYYQNYVKVIEASRKLFDAYLDIDFRRIDKYFWLKGKSAIKE